MSDLMGALRASLDAAKVEREQAEALTFFCGDGHDLREDDGDHRYCGEANRERRDARADEGSSDTAARR